MPGFAFFDPHMHDHQMVVEGARIILASKAGERVRDGRIPIHVDLCLLKGHGVIALLAALESHHVLLQGLYVAGGMGIDQLGCVYFFEGSKILFDNGSDPGFFGGADRIFRRCGDEGGGEEEERKYS